MKYDFKKIIILGVDGKPLVHEKGDEVYRIMASLIHKNLKNLDLLEIATEIWKGKVVELRPADITEIKDILIGPKSTLVPAAKKAVTDFFKSHEK